MPKIRIIVEDDQGNQTEQVHDLAGDLSNLDAMDEAVEHFKNPTNSPQRSGNDRPKGLFG